MSDAHETGDAPAEPTVAQASDGQAPGDEREGGLLVSRRAALVGGALGVAAVLSVGELDPASAMAATGTTGATTTTLIQVPSTGTSPEQLRLAWGADPTTEVTVSWSSPGTVAMPAPTLAYSRSPISDRNPGTVLTLPTTASPLDLSGGPRSEPTATSFADGLSGQTTYHYHAPLAGLEPNTQYYYEVNDGAGTPTSTASGSFFTAPAGRSAYRFTAFGDIGTPYTDNPSGYNWTESSDVSVYTVNGVINPGDGEGPGLFHLMLGDLSYANVNPGSTPAIWRDYQANASSASQNQPWMPIMGNHEVELGICDTQGTASAGPFSGTYNGPFYNGPYGAGNYLARHLLPDNGLKNSDGNSLQGSFYSFQVGTVLFICLNTNDVAFQNPQTVSTGTSGKTPFSSTYANDITLAGITPSVTQYLATGDLTAVASNTQLVPDTSSGTPHLQTQWLEQQLQAARAPGSSVDMIVVCEHHCALSSGPSNGCDMGIRAAWLPLYDQYEVDLVIGGHDHDYEASYPVRGYDQDSPGVATAAFTDPWGNTYASGDPVNTRRPTVVQTEPTPLSSGKSSWNTGAGTVYLQLGAAGAAAGKTPTVDTDTGLRSAVVWAKDAGVSGTQCAKEDATWSRKYDSSSNYGYAVFDVDPGDGPGQTKLTYQWFSVPMPTTLGDQSSVTTDVLYESGGSIVNPALPTTPYEEFVFTRSMSGQVSISGGASGTVQVGGTVNAVPSGWPSGASYSYQWLRNGTAIGGATDASYTTVAADDGQQLSVQVTAQAQSYPATPATSAALTVTDGSISLAVPTISGNAQVGEMLTASANVTVAGAVYGYQWLRDGSPISGATGISYTLSTADGGHSISVQVTVTAPAYQTTSATSTAVIVPAPTGPGLTTPAALGTPVITGTPKVGQTLTAAVSASGGSVSYQWLLDGNAIAGATSSQYKLVAADAGHDVQVRGTVLGAAPVSALSLALRIATAPFAKTAAPKIHGSAIVGHTLTVEIKAWSPVAKFAYQWLLNGHPIQGATHKTLKLKESDAGKKLRVRVTGTHAGYTTKTIVSGTVSVRKTKQKARKPKISGKTLVGQTLHAHVGGWLPETEFTYRWYSGGHEVPGATGHSFRIQPEHRGKRIVLEVTGRLAGQEDVSARSAETRVVRRPWSWL